MVETCREGFVICGILYAFVVREVADVDPVVCFWYGLPAGGFSPAKSLRVVDQLCLD